MYKRKTKTETYLFEVYLLWFTHTFLGCKCVDWMPSPINFITKKKLDFRFRQIFSAFTRTFVSDHVKNIAILVLLLHIVEIAKEVAK